MDTCSNCNAEMRPQASFCSRCGTKRVRAEIPDPVGVIPQSNGVPPVVGLFQRVVMTPRPAVWTNGNNSPTSILEMPADSASSPDEAGVHAPALPMDDDSPRTPLPERGSDDAPAKPLDDVPEAPFLEEPVAIGLSLREETSDANLTPSPAASFEIPPPYDYEPVLDALEHLFDFLDKNREAENRRNIANARQNKSNGKLIGMCLHIFRQVIEVYKNRQTARYLAQDDFKYAFDLVHYALQKSEEELQSAAGDLTRKKAEDHLASAKKYECVLETLCELRAGHLTPAAIMRRARNSYREEIGSMAAMLPWKDIASVVSSYLTEQAQAQQRIPDIPEVARQWAEAYSDIEDVDEEAYTTVLDAAQHHAPDMINPLGFLTKAEQASLRDSLRDLRFEQIGLLFRDKQSALLQRLGEALYDPSFSSALAPRRSIHMVFRKVEFIPWIKELLARQDERAPEQALNWFKWLYEDEYVPAEYAPVLREWHLYVKARARGLLEAFDGWQEDVSQGVASWEEIWNMAATLHEKYSVNALKALLPGVESQRAPFSHLNFALYCAVTILQRKEKYLKESVTLAETFLLENLWKLPVPLSYLTWLALANDAPEVIDSHQHFSRVKVFQELLDHSIAYTYAAHPAHEISIEDFEKGMQELLLLAQKLEHGYVLEAPQKSIALKSIMLGTSFRISYYAARSVRKRVGIYVDYENLLFSLPEEMQHKSELIARTLLEHADTYGDVVSRWVCYSPANIRFLPNVKLNSLQQDFQNAGFKIEVPRDVDGNLKIRANQSDSVLIECITSDMIENKLDVYIIVSGDHFYYERVRRLLEKGHTVSIVSYSGTEEGSEKKVSDKYITLQKMRAFMPKEHGEFTIDNIRDIFHLTAEQVMALDAEIEKRHREKNNQV